MTKFAQFALVLEGLAAFAAGIYFLEDGRSGVGVVLLVLGLFSTVAVLATGSQLQADEDLNLRRADDCPVCRHVVPNGGYCTCSNQETVSPGRR